MGEQIKVESIITEAQEDTIITMEDMIKQNIIIQLLDYHVALNNIVIK